MSVWQNQRKGNAMAQPSVVPWGERKENEVDRIRKQIAEINAPYEARIKAIQDSCDHDFRLWHTVMALCSADPTAPWMPEFGVRCLKCSLIRNFHPVNADPDNLDYLCWRCCEKMRARPFTDEYNQLSLDARIGGQLFVDPEFDQVFRAECPACGAALLWKRLRLVRGGLVKS